MGVGGGLAEDRTLRLGCTRSPESVLTREEFEEDDSQAEEIRTLVEALSANVLGRHVVDSANDLPGGGQLGLRVRCLIQANLLRQPEVENLWRTALRQHDVLGLEVPLDHACGVGCV